MKGSEYVFNYVHVLYTSPKAGCFSRRWLLLVARKSARKKIKNNFFPRYVLFLKGSCPLFHCCHTLRNLKKYMYTLCRSPATFYECLITVMIAFLHTTTAPPQNFCITPWYYIQYQYFPVWIKNMKATTNPINKSF